MRTKVSQVHVKKEMNDLLDFADLKSSDIAAVQAAVDAVVVTEMQGMMSCSCCTELYGNAQELHFHQTGAHSAEELSLALISLRGIDPQIFVSSDPVKEEMESDHLRSLLFDSMTLRSYDSDGETTITVKSDARMAWMSPVYSDVCNISPESVGASSSSFSNQNSELLTSQMSNNNFLDGSLSNFSGIDKFENHLYSTDVNGNTVTKRIKVEVHEAKDSAVSMSAVEAHGILHHAQYSSSEGRTRYEKYEKQFADSSMSSDWFTSKSLKSSSRKTVSFHLDDDQIPQLQCYQNSCEAGKSPQHSTQYNGTSSPLNLLCKKKTESSNKSRKQVKGKKAGGYRSEEERQFICFSCGKIYKKKSHLERHIRVHTGEKPFACPVCPKKFGIRSVLKQHIRTHTGEKPYSCSVCFQRFPQKSGLMTHMMLHNGKPFKCQYCVKSFVSNHKLRHHLRSHGQETETNSNLGQYKCSDCFMRFFTVGALTEHCKVHSPKALDFCQSTLKPEVCVTITEEAARAAVSVLGKSMQFCDNTIKNEFDSEIFVDKTFPDDQLLLDSFPLDVERLSSSVLSVKSEGISANS